MAMFTTFRFYDLLCTVQVSKCEQEMWGLLDHQGLCLVQGSEFHGDPV